MGEINKHDIDALFDRQLRQWELAHNNYAALDSVRIKQLPIDEATFKVQFNPARIISSAAKVDSKSIKERRCFLCETNRPTQQEGLQWGGKYIILVNPYPIFPRHLTIPVINHEPQRIAGRIADMMQLAADLEEFVVFYNGPRCGASAPDHAHFQAGNKGFMSFDREIGKPGVLSELKISSDSSLYITRNLARRSFVIKSTSIGAGTQMFERLYNALPSIEGEDEPMLNILCWVDNGEWNIAVFPRVKHRPSCYFAEGDSNLLITPASVDMGGVFITPLEKDFDKVTANDLRTILDEVCISEAAALQIIEQIK